MNNTGEKQSFVDVSDEHKATSMDSRPDGLIIVRVIAYKAPTKCTRLKLGGQHICLISASLLYLLATYVRLRHSLYF
jgi:hypothetical protein